MRLAHHLERVHSLRVPTAHDPWRVLMSGCLAGWPCGVDGTDYGLPSVAPTWLADTRVRCIPFCPEDHGLGTPRTTPDLHGGDGFAVLDGEARVLDEHGVDLTDAILMGAQAMLVLAQREQIDFAVLTDRSGVCGSQVISIGCRFVEPVHHRRGVGVATALLLRHGFDVVSQRDPRTLGLIGARLDGRFAPGPDVVDHHESAWVRANLPLDDARGASVEGETAD